MASAISLILIAAGAVLYFAVTKTVEGIGLDNVGVILMITGAVGLVISLVMVGTERARLGRTTVVDTSTPTTAQGSSTVVHDAGR